MLRATSKLQANHEWVKNIHIDPKWHKRKPRHCDHHLVERPEDGVAGVGHPDVLRAGHHDEDGAADRRGHEEGGLADQRPVEARVAEGEGERGAGQRGQGLHGAVVQVALARLRHRHHRLPQGLDVVAYLL